MTDLAQIPEDQPSKAEAVLKSSTPDRDSNELYTSQDLTFERLPFSFAKKQGVVIVREKN
ncbi:MAG: hypothetical protein ACI8O8_001012, partial [Oleiphilaceae bacterium]